MSYVVKVPFFDKEDGKHPYYEVGAPYPAEGRKKPREEWLKALASDNNNAKCAVIEMKKDSKGEKGGEDKGKDKNKDKTPAAEDSKGEKGGESGVGEQTGDK